MAISNELTRVKNGTDRIKTKTQALGLKLDNGNPVTISDPIEKQAEAIENIETMSGSNVSLTNSEQTISCKGKMMTGDIVVPSANVYYTGTNTPDGSLGNDGDLYLVI